jgi:type II secretory pathway pseudopilin PulG
MQRRNAFTLVEMLVAMALVIFIMVILSEAFVAGLESFRQLKAIGDMEERLRTVTSILRADLTADHFDGRRRLSDNDFWVQGPPREGFFRIWQESAPMIEGNDTDGLPSFRATNHALHYTVRSRGNRREDFFRAQILTHNPLLPGESALNGQTNFFATDQPSSSRYQDPGTYTGPWKEVAVFLRPNGSSTQGTTNGAIPLFGLYRRSLLAVPDNRHINWETFADPANVGNNTPIVVPSAAAIATYLASNQATFSEISCKKRTSDYSANGYPDTLYFNNPTDLTIPERRFGMSQTPQSSGWPIRATIPGGGDLRYPIYGDVAGTPLVPLLTQDPSLQGADLLIDDVISFEVQVLAATTPTGSTFSTVIVPFGKATGDFLNLFDVALDGGNPQQTSLRTNTNFFRPRSNPGGNLNFPAVFDTWSSQKGEAFVTPGSAIANDYTVWDPNFTGLIGTATVPLKIRILAIKIILRVWDKKSQQARQITLVQDT